MKISYAIGGGLVAIGGVLYLLSNRDHKVTLVATTTTTALVAWGRF